MQKRLPFKMLSLVFVGLLFMFLLICGGCNHSSKLSQPTDVLPLSQQVLEYYESTIAKPFEFSEGYSAYFDFSDGMEFAYKDPVTRANLKSITQTVTGNVDDWKVYSLAADKVESLSLTQTELFNKIISTRYYDIKAPIEGALKQIVDEGKRSFMVTDFEEYDFDSQLKKDVIEQQAYATPYIQDWLTKGGVIKFYITPFMEKNLHKKLFFVVFDSKDLQLADIIEKSMAGNEKNYEEFLLSATPYELTTDYTPGRGGNYHDDSGHDIVLGVLESASDPCKYENYKGLNAEYYPMGEAWSNVPTNVWTVRSMEGSNYYGLLSRLYIDLSNQDSFRIKDLQLKVKDVTDDLFLYSTYRAALRNTPDIQKDEAGNPIVSFTTHPDASFYYDNITGEMYDQCKYTPQALLDVEHLLKINEDVFEASYEKDPSKTQIVIDLDDAFLNAQFTQDPKTMFYNMTDPVLVEKVTALNGRTLRVDVCLGESDFDDARIRELFVFESNLFYKDGASLKRRLEPNDCIYSSIRQVFLKDGLSPKDKVIYTYFIMD